MSSCATKKNITTNKNNLKNTLKTRNNSLEDFANALGVSKNDLKNQKLYFYIDDWLGTPHKMGGLTKNGIDCSAFVTKVYSEVYNEDLPRTSRDMAEIVKNKRINNLNEGDLVFFAFGGKKIDHVGIYLHNNRFVHVSTKRGVIISNLNDIWYAKYLVKSGNLK